jgi:transglutaminase-like putative cysteine protease
MSPAQKHFGWFVLKRMLGFAIIMALILVAVFQVFDKDFKAVEKQWNESGGKYDKNKSNSESMTKENKDGSISNKDQTQLSGSLNKGKRLVFVAKLDNYFEDGKTPNPLYFTAYHFTRFDTLTQTFETDSLMPAKDLFRPDPSKIPIYFAKTDSTVIKNTNATKSRKIVNAEIYKTLLAPNEFVAPSTAFFCQPLPVENAYKEQYKSAYRAKMWVSDLNSAYFIYNPAGNQMLESFQAQRFNILRQVKDFSGIDDNFMKYYTFMPTNAEYDRIRTLAKEITKNAVTPVDKIIAIRDYFMGKDEFGQPLFKYTNNPGVPGIPSANKLTYFLFENRKGYCAYYAGATLFLLRALGMPSRVTAGFLTVDRSSKNPGWYWFYEDQAHAWVQVYFPGYGWIDFDTTVPDQDTHDSPQPDGTPPLNMQQAFLVADGKLLTVDTVKRQATMTVEKLLFHDQNYETTRPDTLTIDAAIANVTTDTGSISFSKLKKDMHITAASFAEVLKNMKPNPEDKLSEALQRIPHPTPVDEIKVVEPEDAISPSTRRQFEEPQPIDWLKVLRIALLTLVAVALVVFSLPWLIWQFLHQRAKGARQSVAKAFYQYRAALYYLNQLGYARTHLGPGQLARQTDEQFGTQFYTYSNIYQKLKYSTVPLTERERNEVAQFYIPFIQSIRQQVPFKTRVARFLNIYHTIHYFTQPK